MNETTEPGIRKSLPLRDQETVISRMRGERWRLDTSEPTVARLLLKKGYVPVGDDGVGHYLRFELPANALTFRSLFALENLRRAENLPNGSAVGEDGPQESPKAGRDSSQAPPIDDDSDSSAAPLGERQEEAPKSPNVGRSDTEDSPAVGRCV